MRPGPRRGFSKISDGPILAPDRGKIKTLVRIGDAIRDAARLQLRRILTRNAYIGADEWCCYSWKEGDAHHFNGPGNATETWAIKNGSPQAMIHLAQKPADQAAQAIEYSFEVRTTCYGALPWPWFEESGAIQFIPQHLLSTTGGQPRASCAKPIPGLSRSSATPVLRWRI